MTLWETSSRPSPLFLDESDVETVRRVRATQVPDPTSIDPQYPRALAAALGHALERDPNDRYQTAAQLREALDAFVATCGRVVDAASVRALTLDLLGNEAPLEWERLFEDADKDRTRVWERPRLPPPSRPPKAKVFAPSARRRVSVSWGGLTLPGQALAIASGSSVVALAGAVLVARGCRASDRVGGLEQRVARIELLLGLDDAGAAPAAPQGAQAAVSVDDRAGACALSKVAGYQVWQEAVAKARVNAGGAEAACASIWNEKRKQACFYVAMSGIRATQAARDALIVGAASEREALRNVKDDPKNDAIARARAASQAAFVACDDDGGP
jgi:hypothetical protein